MEEGDGDQAELQQNAQILSQIGFIKLNENADNESKGITLWARWEHACPGSIPGRDNFLGEVFSGFFFTCKTNVGKL